LRLCPHASTLWTCFSICEGGAADQQINMPLLCVWVVCWAWKAHGVSFECICGVGHLSCPPRRFSPPHTHVTVTGRLLCASAVRAVPCTPGC
jgi:hypothetical protein